MRAATSADPIAVATRACTAASTRAASASSSAASSSSSRCLLAGRG